MAFKEASRYCCGPHSLIFSIPYSSKQFSLDSLCFQAFSLLVVLLALCTILAGLEGLLVYLPVLSPFFRDVL